MSVAKEAPTPKKSSLVATAAEGGKKKQVGFEEKEHPERGAKKSDMLGEGQFDEDESHQSFLQALNAWRGVKAPEPEKPKDISVLSAVAANSKYEKVEKKAGSFFANLSGVDNCWNHECIPSFQETACDPI